MLREEKRYRCNTPRPCSKLFVHFGVALVSILSISNPLEIYIYVLWITGKVGPIFIQMPFDGKIFEKGSYYGIRWIEIFRFILRKCIQIKLTIR